MARIPKALAVLAAAALIALSLYSCKGKQQEGGAPSGDATIAPMFPQQARMLESTLREDPNNAGILVQLGNLYYDWGQQEIDTKGQMAQPAEKWDKAIMYYRRALAIDPRNVNVRVDMANLVQFMGDVDGAVAEYYKAMEIDPKQAQARINLILALGQRKQDYKAAVREYEALLRVAPEQKNNESLKQEVDSYRKLAKGVAK